MLHFINVLDNSRNTLDHARRALDDAEFQPLSTRSLLLSYLLGTHPPELPVAHLTSFGARFGVREGTVRTALSRMVGTGELTTTGDGRYRLAGRMTDRQRQQQAGLADPPGDWDGTWWTAIVAHSERTATERRHFRSGMVGERMGELRPDIWMRPANIAGPSARPGLLVTRGPLVNGDATELGLRLWDVEALESTATVWSEILDDLHVALDTDPPAALPVAFDVSAAVVRLLRAEPQLPTVLAETPSCRTLRHTYRDFNPRFRASLDHWLRDAA
jgi:phenylacetic acid degradation operon negative regulatory protein